MAKTIPLAGYSSLVTGLAGVMRQKRIASAARERERREAEERELRQEQERQAEEARMTRHRENIELQLKIQTASAARAKAKEDTRQTERAEDAKQRLWAMKMDQKRDRLKDQIRKNERLEAKITRERKEHESAKAREQLHDLRRELQEDRQEFSELAQQRGFGQQERGRDAASKRAQQADFYGTRRQERSQEHARDIVLLRAKLGAAKAQTVKAAAASYEKAFKPKTVEDAQKLARAKATEDFELFEGVEWVPIQRGTTIIFGTQ